MYRGQIIEINPILLNGRSQRIRIQSCFFDEKSVFSGVLQGSEEKMPFIWLLKFIQFKVPATETLLS